MLNAEMHYFDAGSDPAPTFPTDAEIEMAEQLRHQLEERYLGAPSASQPNERAAGQPPKAEPAH